MGICAWEIIIIIIIILVIFIARYLTDKGEHTALHKIMSTYKYALIS